MVSNIAPIFRVLDSGDVMFLSKLQADKSIHTSSSRERRQTWLKMEN